MAMSLDIQGAFVPEARYFPHRPLRVPNGSIFLVFVQSTFLNITREASLYIPVQYLSHAYLTKENVATGEQI